MLVGESCTVYSRLIHTLHCFLELSHRCSIVAFFLSNHRTVGVSIQALHHGLHIHGLSVRGGGGVLGVARVFRSCAAPAQSTETYESPPAELAGEDNDDGD